MRKGCEKRREQCREADVLNTVVEQGRVSESDYEYASQQSSQNFTCNLLQQKEQQRRGCKF